MFSMPSGREADESIMILLAATLDVDADAIVYTRSCSAKALDAM